MSHILIIDDAAYFRMLVKHMLQSAMPGVVVEEYDPLLLGCPKENFDWSGYDALLLDYKLGEEDGLEWFRKLKDRHHFPATIMFTGEGNESLAVMAMKSGIEDYLTKADLNPERIKNAVIEAIDATQLKRNEEELDTDTALEKTLITDFSKSSKSKEERSRLRFTDIPGYQIVQKIGTGASATTYLAEREADQQEVVLKILHPELMDQKTLLQRFLAEYRVISALDTPFIVSIYDQGFTPNYCYIAMEHLPDGDLRSKIKQGISPRKAANYLAQLAVGLHVMHKQGIVHRDIKPENILFRENGTPVICDFGIARQIEHEAGLTRHGEVFGTPHYISPEQISGDSSDARSDLYSLGVILYEMLTGKRPFQGSSLYNLFYNQMNQTIPPLKEDSMRFQPIVDGLLCREPKKRTASAAKLFRSIKELCKFN